MGCIGGIKSLSNEPTLIQTYGYIMLKLINDFNMNILVAWVMNMVEYTLVPISTHCLGHTLPIINTAIPLYGHLVKLQPVLLCGHPVILQPIIHTILVLNTISALMEYSPAYLLLLWIIYLMGMHASWIQYLFQWSLYIMLLNMYKIKLGFWGSTLITVVSILNNTLSYHGGSTSLTNRTMLMKYYYCHHMWLLNHLVLVQINPASTLSIYSLKIFMKQ